MTTIVKKKVRRAKRRDYPKHRFVVYMSKHGKTEPGIYERQVSFDGPIAFVHPVGDALKADMLPRLCVFDSRDDAHRYFTKDGVPKWVVYRKHGRLRVFQARVRAYLVRRHGNFTSYVTSIVKNDGEVLTGNYDVVSYDSEADAYRHLKSHMKDDLKEADEKIKEGQVLKKDLLKLKQRMTELGVSRGYRKRRI